MGTAGKAIVVWPAFVALMSCAAPTSSVRQPVHDESVDWIVIDGARQPERLPEWLVWENVLSGIYIIRDRKLEGSPFDSLAVTPPELKRIEATAFWHHDHSDACEDRQKNEVARLRTARRGAAEITRRQREVILKCRRQVLDRVDTLLHAISDRSRAALLAYAESKKKGMWARVAKSELDFFRQPR